MMIRRYPTDSEYAAIGKTLITALPHVSELDDVAEQVGMKAFHLSINLLRSLMAEQPEPVERK